MYSSVSSEIRKAAANVEAGILSNAISKIKMTVQKIPQGIEALKSLANMTPSKIIEALGGKVDRATFEEAQKLLAGQMSKEASLFKSLRDTKKIVMTAVLILFVAGIAGKAAAQSYDSFNKAFNDLHSKAKMEMVDHKDAPKDMADSKIEVKKVNAPSKSLSDKEHQALTDSLVQHDIDGLSKLVKNPVGIEKMSSPLVQGHTISEYPNINDGIIKAIDETPEVKDHLAKTYTVNTLTDVIEAALLKRINSEPDPKFHTMLEKVDGMDTFKEVIKHHARHIAEGVLD